MEEETVVETNRLGWRAACLVAALAATLPAAAQTYPVKPVRMVVGFSAGGATDIVARAIGQNLHQAFGQPVIVDNRPGAASNIAADHVAKSPPDGYTLFMGSISLANNATLYSNLPYNALRDLAPIVHVTNTPFMLCVHPSIPVKSVKELVAFAKARPGQVQYGTAGNGSGAHLFTELFASMAGIKMQAIPYKGAAPAVNDLVGGQLAFVFDNVIGMVPLHKAGKLRCLAASSRSRSPIAPDIPTMQEAGIAGYVADAWFGLFAPAGTPAAVIERVNAEVNRAMQAPAIRNRFETLGCEPAGGSAAAFGAYFKSEIEKWGKVIRSAGVRLQ
ncbi:MAG: tripartite tricarboxylate transporter substrate binding protein [Betaproteobacteria bacterium]|nr:tripartite tricarboxylate transporter substrate binding protein [Betaproteobacteria bacterium]